jgi:N-acetyl-D-muramate 6-phosphate phosphatase
LIKSILFDLDGTLVDTAPDLGYALNIQLARHGKGQLKDAAIRPFASHGSAGLLNLGFGITARDTNFISMRDEYLAIYKEVFTRSPTLFDGVEDVLQVIEKKGLMWGIVTNKPARFTQPLIKSMGLDTRAACVLSGDDALKPKPAPDTLLMACEQMQVSPEDCIYVGDAERDIQAGRLAGMTTVIALFGYIHQTDRPLDWGADAMINSPKDLLTLLA